MQPLRFNDAMLQRPAPRGIDVQTSLAHFAIISYCVHPERLRSLIHPRYELRLINVEGLEWALLSVVPFIDKAFHFVRWPHIRWHFGQTNYRAYVIDRQTGEDLVWFFATALDSLTALVPKYRWQMPWHRTTINFDCRYDEASSRYERYQMVAQGALAAKVVLEDTGAMPRQLAGFDDLESGMVLLTHPLRGVYYRRDGRLGSYQIWHDKLHPTVAYPVEAHFQMFDTIGLANMGDFPLFHSALLQHRTDFTVYLPPTIVGD